MSKNKTASVSLTLNELRALLQAYNASLAGIDIRDLIRTKTYCSAMKKLGGKRDALEGVQIQEAIANRGRTTGSGYEN